MRNLGTARAITTDLRDRDSIDAMFDGIDELDILINCAGIAPKAPILSGSFDDFSELLQVNVLALTYCAQLAVRRFGDNGGQSRGLYGSENFCYSHICQYEVYLPL